MTEKHTGGMEKLHQKQKEELHADTAKHAKLLATFTAEGPSPGDTGAVSDATNPGTNTLCEEEHTEG